jgi:choline dehydrogenase-like flavoprotein
MANLEKIDVVIVGAGAAGSTYAAVLTRAGKKVVLLEQGPDWKHSDLVSSDIWGRRLRKASPSTVLDGRDPIGKASDHGWGTGGAALHYSANFPRLLPSDFHMKSQHGRGLDWPISYQDVAPYYDRAAREIGVSGDAKAEERWRPPGEPYPMPPLPTFPHGEVWVKGFNSVGITVAPGAVGVNSIPYKGRAACIHDGWCGAGCPTGALANPQATLLGEARAKGAEVRPLSTVSRVLTDAAGRRVTGVEYYDANRERQVQEASVVILAAFASQNPRIMFNSATDKHPRGLANASGLLGKYAMAHAGVGLSALFDADLQNHMGSFGYQFVSYDRHPKTTRKEAFGSTFWNTGAASKPTDTRGLANVRPDLFGEALDHFLKVTSRGLSRITAVCEDLPNIDNRMELASEKDEFGLPLIRITHSYDQDVMGLARAALDEGVAIAKGAGASEIRPGRGIGPQHLLGGTIMGAGASDSVVNSFGQTHEIANLWVAGCGIFPTISSANPTFTLFALSLRGADELAARWGSIAS